MNRKRTGGLRKRERDKRDKRKEKTDFVYSDNSSKDGGRMELVVVFLVLPCFSSDNNDVTIFKCFDELLSFISCRESVSQD